MSDWHEHDGGSAPEGVEFVEVNLGRGVIARCRADELSWGWGGQKSPSYGDVHRWREITQMDSDQ